VGHERKSNKTRERIIHPVAKKGGPARRRKKKTWEEEKDVNKILEWQQKVQRKEESGNLRGGKILKKKEKNGLPQQGRKKWYHSTVGFKWWDGKK